MPTYVWDVSPPKNVPCRPGNAKEPIASIRCRNFLIAPLFLATLRNFFKRIPTLPGGAHLLGAAQRQAFNHPMGRLAQKGILLAGLISICELTALQAALAEPPLLKGSAVLSHGSKAPEREAPHLDLRAPSQNSASTEAPTSTAQGGHRLFESNGPFRAEQSDSARQGHINSPLQNVVHNFQREGLPIARLFQNDNSLVHLGLNPKGKPGLWIVHKLH
jgi:hypothetical protein